MDEASPARVIRRVGGWPATTEFRRVAAQLREAMTSQIMDLLWHGIEQLILSGFRTADFSGVPTQLERALNQQLHAVLQRHMDRTLPFSVIHEVFEFASLTTRRGRPAQPDFGFQLHEHIDIIWPLEAKVLQHPDDTSEYVAALNKNFLTCRYAPLSAEGAMLGYLLSGTCREAFRRIEAAVPCELNPGPGNPPRDYMVSEHVRSVPAESGYDAAFRCHHVLVLVSLEG